MRHTSPTARFLTAMLLVAWCAGTSLAKSGSMDQAKAAARNGDWILAMQLTQRVLSAEPGNADAFALQGDYHWSNGDSARAADSYEKALKNNPKHPDGIVNLTIYYLAVDRIGDADRLVADAESRDLKGKVDQIRAARGLVHAKQGNFAEATKLLVSLATKKPDNPLYPQLLARLYNEKGVQEQAVQYYEQAHRLNPADMDIAYEYALVLQDLQRYDETLAVLKEVQQKNADNKSVDYLIGRIYYASARNDPKLWGDAARNLQFAVDKRPDHFLSQFLLGKSLLEYSKTERRNLYKNAELCLRTARDLRPNRADVQESLNQVLDIQGRINLQAALADSVASRTTAFCDTALVYFRELAAADPAFKGVHANMAKIWAKLAVPDSTILYCRKELEHHPEDSQTLSRLVSTLQRKKDQDGLVATLRPRYEGFDWGAPAEGETGPRQDFLAKYGGILANAYLELGQGQAARDVLERLLAFQPAWKDGHLLNAYIDLKRNNYTGAIPVLEKAAAVLPNEAEIWLQLGDCHYFANPKHRPSVLKAKDCYQKAMQLGSRDGAEKFRQLGAVK